MMAMSRTKHTLPVWLVGDAVLSVRFPGNNNATTQERNPFSDKAHMCAILGFIRCRVSRCTRINRAENCQFDLAPCDVRRTRANRRQVPKSDGIPV